MDVLVESTVPVVLAESTRMAIEKIATEFAQEMLADPSFRAELREIVKRVSAQAAAELRGAHKRT